MGSVYLFGYGSLVNVRSASKTLKRHINMSPAILLDFPPLQEYTNLVEHGFRSIGQDFYNQYIYTTREPLLDPVPGDYCFSDPEQNAQARG